MNPCHAYDIGGLFLDPQCRLWETTRQTDNPVPGHCCPFVRIFFPATGRMDSLSHLGKEAREVALQYQECDYCFQFMIRNMSFPSRYSSEQEIDSVFNAWRRHTMTASCLKFGKNRSHSGNGTYSGPWAFTLTMAPTDALDKSDLIRAVRKVMGQQSIPAVRYAWHYEDKGVDSEGRPIHPHIHGMYETATGGRIEKKHWKRAWSIWDESSRQGAGFRGGYHRPVRSNEGYLDYIAKDGKESDSWNVENKSEECNITDG